MDGLDYGVLSHGLDPDCGYLVESFCGTEHIDSATVRSEDQSEELASHWLTASRADRVIVTDGDSGEIVAVW